MIEREGDELRDEVSDCALGGENANGQGEGGQVAVLGEDARALGEDLRLEGSACERNQNPMPSRPTEEETDELRKTFGG